MQPGAMAALPANGIMTLRQTLLALVMVAAILSGPLGSEVLTLAGVGALLAYLLLGIRAISLGAWVPIGLALLVLAMALALAVPAEVIRAGAARMLFLSGMLAVLNTLSAAAAIAPEVALAGTYLTGQPASRRYLALNSGGHIFGVLINFGGLAVLLELAQRSQMTPEALKQPQELRDLKLRRMVMAIMRGFGMISLWSPLSFSVNAVLLSLPGITYAQFGLIGFAMTFVLCGIGWGYDALFGRRFRPASIARPKPPAGAWVGAAMLVGHMICLGLSVWGLHAVLPLSFQESLIIVVPSYSLIWAVVSGLRGMGGAGAGVAAVAGGTWQKLPRITSEIGLFAAAGFLSVVLLAIIPMDLLRDLIAVTGFGPLALSIGLSCTIFVLACIGVNPIVVSTVLGAILWQQQIPDLSNVAIALAILGGWTAVIGFSPIITTVVYCAAATGRSPFVVGPLWNGLYSLTVLAVWVLLMSVLHWTGLV